MKRTPFPKPPVPTRAIKRYYISANSGNIRHWTVRAVVELDGKEKDSERVFFKGIKRDCEIWIERASLQ